MSDPSDNESYKFENIFLQDFNSTDNSESTQCGDNNKAEYPKVMLTNEERRLLSKEGITLPAHYPLTKHEERELKRIRRKIRNKISAQDSRKRKKEYVDGLEERVKKCTDENQTLLKRIKLLQHQNQNLMSQMKKMQSLLTKGTSKTAQPATCLMVLLLSMALIAAPNLKLGNNKDIAGAASDILMEENVSQNRRSLLFDTQEKLSDVIVDEEMFNDFTPLNAKLDNFEHNYAEIMLPIGKNNDKEKTLIDYDVDDTIWTPPSKRNKTQDSVVNNNMLSGANAIFETTMLETEQLIDKVNRLNSTHTKMYANGEMLQIPIQMNSAGIPDIAKLAAEVTSNNINVKEL